METISPWTYEDESFSPDGPWQGSCPSHAERALGGPPPLTVFEDVAVADLPVADKKPKTTPITQTKRRLPTGNSKNKDEVEITGQDFGSD